MCEELAPVGNRQLDALRAVIGQSAASTPSWLEDENALYDELSRLNNELVTLQRELAKKNAELERLNEQVQGHALELEQRVDERTTELQASESRFRGLFEQAAVGIVLFDTAGHVLESNPALQEMVGDSADLWQFIAGDDVVECTHICRELSLKRRRCQNLERPFTRADGQPGWANVTLSLIAKPDSETQFLIGMVEDVTEKKNNQAALLQAEKLAVAGRLAASLAHEVSNPLQTVIGCVGLAQEALAEGRDAGQLLQVAIEELRRVSRVVADLRNLHRPTSVEDKEPADVNALLEQVLTLCRKKCEEYGVEVTWRPATGLSPLPLVTDRIQQVFLNLVLNALDAMPGGGGQLDVYTERTGQPPGVRAVFSDSGEGISPDVLPHIFEPFYTSKPEGLGLGLFISQEIVRQHDGRIDVQSQVGEGTTLTVWLPG
jgi:PAS domain S-box-containing protein